MERIYDMIIIGGGPGGYTAALYAARSGLDVVVLEKLSAGGQMALTTQVDNYPGFPQGVDGFQLALAMQEGAERFGAVTEYAEVLSCDLSKDVKVLETSEGTFRGRTIVISTGASPRPLGLPGEEELVGRGLHYCAACDGMFYKGKTVVVVGGGNSAAADAMALSRIAKKVILVHRRDTLRATQVYHKPLMEAENVEFLWNSQVTELHRENRLTGIAVEDLVSGEIREVECDGVFVSIGRQPASSLFAGQLEMDDSGYIVAGESGKTNIPGVYAVGDVRTKALRQIITAASDGANAAHEAEGYLASLHQ
ncbi:MAG: thioredoxin-disulfide reductase [Oscillospiraceae bacterium]|nr:thioredoxin-disulfide reductase [Oscillospiraceae bacterium]